METITSKCRASNCCQNYHQGSILGQDNLLWLNQSTFVKSARKGVQNVPSEKKHIGNWSLTRVPNPWYKYVDSKHCWERFSEIGTNTCRFYIQNIYSLHRQASKIERTRGSKNLWRWNVERIMAIKEPMMDKARLTFFSKPLLHILKADSSCLASYAWDAFGNRMLCVFI